MQLAYVDSSVWIALFEGILPYQNRVGSELAQLENNGWKFAYSEAVELELLIKPGYNQQTTLLQNYRQLFGRLIRLPATTTLFQRSLLAGVMERLKPMDALHTGFALEHQCSLFITTDLHFKKLNSQQVHFIDLRTQKIV